MGRPKQLLPFRGSTLLRHAAETALAAGCSPVVVVLGANADTVGESVAGLSVITTRNEDWAAGMGGSIQAGLRVLADTEVDEAILGLCDQPFVTADFYRDLIAEHARSGAAIVSARYEGTVGVPVLFARSMWSKLEALPLDQGCKGVILRNQSEAVLVDCPEAAVDVDTPEDYAGLGAG